MTIHATPAVHLYIHSPTALFKARVNMPTVTYPVTELTFDTVTLGAYTDLAEDMTVLLGSSEGADDLGRTRIKGTPTASAIGIGRASRGVEDGTLDVSDNAYITVLDDFRVWAKLPYQDPNGVDYKDGNVPVGDFMTDIPPVVIMGGGFADYIDGSDIITVDFDASGSYAMATGATITTYAWDVGDGTITVGTSADAAITATFPAGFRWVALTITDSNGVSMTGRRPVLAVDADADVTIPTAQVESQRLTQQGQTLRVKFPADLPRSTYPDGTLAMLWWDAPSDPADRSHMKFTGWHQSDDASLRAMRQGLVRETTLDFLDVAGRLDTLPGFPQALERSNEVAWYYSPSLDIDKALHYLLFWHSTALGLADFYLPDGGDAYPSMRLDSTGATLYDQANSRALSMVPDHILTCSSTGELRVLEDWQLVDVGDRPTAAPILTEDDYGELTFAYQRPPRVHVLRASAIVASTDWVMLGGEETLPLAFSIAPGEAFSQGTNEQSEAEGLTRSQDELNVSTGHRYARLNARFGPARVRLLNLDDFWDYEPAPMPRVQLNIAAAYAAQRGLPFTSVNTMVKELTVRYNVGRNGLAVEAEAVLELETSGAPAVTHVPEVEEPSGDYEVPPPPPSTEPPPVGLVEGVQQVAGIGLDGYIYRTSDFQTASGSGGPTWTRVDTTIADTIYSWVVDPFSPGYIDGVGAINGWIVNDTGIYRVTDLFGSVAAASVFTFDEPTVAASFHWRSIQASFGAYFAEGANPWLLCVSYYGDTTGHAGTWATYSTDGGVTWAAEVQLSAEYATGDDRFYPIGVYASPKTPGLGYTVARGQNLTDGEPHFVAFDDAGVLTDLGPGATTTWVVTRDPAPSGLASGTDHICVAPPVNTARVRMVGSWSCVTTKSGLDSISGSVGTNSPGTNVSHSGDFGFSIITSNPGGTTSGSFECEWTLDDPPTQTWPGDISDIGIAPGGDESADYGVRISANLVASDTGGNGDCEIHFTCSLSVVEIELEDGTLYTFGASDGVGKRTTNWGATWSDTAFIQPGAGMAGTIHLPWEGNGAEQIAYYGHFDASSGNREFRLMRVSGGVHSDVSPDDTGVFFGPNRGHFGARTFDGNGVEGPEHVLLAGVGNDASSDADDDTHAVFYSDDSGATWTLIEGPDADSVAPAGRPAYEAAFGGDSPDVIFIWGASNYISYSDDAGVTVDSRAGNLSSFGTVYLIGIAGGVS